MIDVDVKSLSNQLSTDDMAYGRVYPPLRQIPEVSVKIATDLAEWFYKTSKATTYPEPNDKEDFIRKQLYDPTYTSYVPSQWDWPVEHTTPKSLLDCLLNSNASNK
jgi:malate dehydrogenase (oxaloacetate-decarboxylating)(NADP+)